MLSVKTTWMFGTRHMENPGGIIMIWYLFLGGIASSQWTNMSIYPYSSDLIERN